MSIGGAGVRAQALAESLAVDSGFRFSVQPCGRRLTAAGIEVRASGDSMFAQDQPFRLVGL